MPARYRTAAWWSRGAAAAAELPAALRSPKRDVPQAPSELACLRPRQRLTPRKPPSPAGRRKCEGATGSLATLAPDRSPSHPPQHPTDRDCRRFPAGSCKLVSDTTPVAVSANRIKKERNDTLLDLTHCDSSGRVVAPNRESDHGHHSGFPIISNPRAGRRAS
jgi:hypothetical protein